MAVYLIDYASESDQTDILNGTGAYCDSYLASAIAAGEGIIIFPRGKMLFASTVSLKTKVHFVGEGTFSECVWDNDRTCIIIHDDNTIDAGTEDPATTSAAGSVIENLVIQAASSGSTTGHGIWMRAPAFIRNCTLKFHGGNAVHIVAWADNADTTKIGDARGWCIERTRLASSAIGLYIEGDQAHRGTSFALDLTSNDAEGLYDKSTYGNMHFGAHTASNGTTSFRTEGSDNQSGIFAAYAEENQDPISASAKTSLIGGILTSIDRTTGVQVLNYGTSSPLTVQSDDAGTWVTKINVIPDNFINFIGSGDPSEYGLSYKYNATVNTYYMSYDNSTTPSMSWTTDNTTYVDNDDVALAGGQLILDGVWCLNNADSKYSFFDFADVLDQLADFEDRITALEP